MMVSITDPHLRVSLLMHLIERFDRGELVPLLESGVSPGLLDKLRQLEMGSLLRIGEMRHPEIHFNVSEPGLEFSLEAIERHNNEIAELIYFIHNGASLSMLNQLFPAQDTKLIQQYRRILLDERKVGRTALPDERTRDAIHRLWHSLQNGSGKADSARERLRILHESFQDYRIDVLYATVNEFEELVGANTKGNKS